MKYVIFFNIEDGLPNVVNQVSNPEVLKYYDGQISGNSFIRILDTEEDPRSILETWHINKRTYNIGKHLPQASNAEIWNPDTMSWILDLDTYKLNMAAVASDKTRAKIYLQYPVEYQLNAVYDLTQAQIDEMRNYINSVRAIYNSAKSSADLKETKEEVDSVYGQFYTDLDNFTIIGQ